MKRIMNWLMLSCRKATELIEKRTVTKLSLAEKMQLGLHTSMCSGCKAYQQQSGIMDKWLTNHFLKAQEPKPENTDKLKERIISKITGQ